MKHIRTMIGLLIICLILLCMQWGTGHQYETEDYALAFAIYAALRADETRA